MSLSSPFPQIHQSFITGHWNRRLIGYYISTADIINKPDYIDMLQKKFGVNMLISSHPLKYTEEILEKNPLQGKGYICQGYTEDDSLLRKAIDETHRRGMDFWLMYYGIHGAEKFPEWSVRDFNNIPLGELTPIPYASEQSQIAFCLSRPEIKEWNREIFTFGASHYDVDAVYTCHFRYANPSFFTGIFGCACPSCQNAAERMGYNFTAMKNVCRKLQQRLKNLSLSQVKEAAKLHFSLMDWLTFLTDGQEILNWLRFRASVMSEQLRIIYDSVHSVADKYFFVDTHPCTMSLLVGHNLNDFQNGCTDALMQLAWLDAQLMSCIASWSWLLCNWVPGLDEPTALRIVYNFFGLDHLPLPKNRIMDIGLEPNWYELDRSIGFRKRFYTEVFNDERVFALQEHEMRLLRVLNTTGIASYPIIKWGEWSTEVTEKLIDRAFELGHNGVVIERII